MERRVEVVSNRVYFQIRSDNPTAGIHMNESDGFIYHYHCIDTLYKTAKLRKYFGPVTLSTIHRYCTLVDANLKYTAGRHLYYTNNSETVGYQKRRTNAVFLVGCYLILRRDWSPDKTQEKLQRLKVSLTPYTDMEGSTAHALSLLDCWRALYQGMIVHQWFNNKETATNIVLNDGSSDIMNWIVPYRLMALEDPKEPRYTGRGPRVRSAIVDYFKLKRVETVVRLNAKDYQFRTSYGQPYDSEEFVCRAIKHYDMFFKDGGIPSDAQVHSFLKIVRKARNPVAVHCHAGRGRTGTMVACSLIRFWGFEAAQAIAWVRMCRIACIVGIQQDFLKMFECRLRPQPKAMTVCRNLQQVTGKVCLEREESTKEKERAEKDSVATHPRVRRRPTNKRRSHNMKSTRSHQKKEIRLRQRNDNCIEEVTVLPINEALTDVRQGRQQTSGHNKTSPESQRRILLESYVNVADKKNKSNPEIDEAKALDESHCSPQHKEKTKARFDIKILRRIHPFHEQQTQEAKYRRAETCEKITANTVKPNVANSSLNMPAKKRTVENTKAKGLEALLKCHLVRKQRSVPYELKETTGEAHEEMLKMCPAKGHINISKSSVPFVDPAKRYFGYQPTFDQLAKLLNFEKDSKCPVPSCPTEYKTVVSSSRKDGDKDGENDLTPLNRNARRYPISKKCKTVMENFVNAEHRLAWQGDIDPQSLPKAVLRDSRAIHDEFVEKQRKALFAFKANHSYVKDKIKIRNIQR